MAKSFSGRSWIDIRSNGAKFQTELKRMSAHVTNVPSEVAKGYYAAVRDIAWQGVRLGREKILNDTNTLKYRRTGKKGRVDTGDMAKAFWANVRKSTDKQYVVNVGYLGGKPGYSIFQEYGTRRGLAGVEALRASQDYIDQEIKKLGKGGRNYKSTIGKGMRGVGLSGQANETPPEWFRGGR